MLNKITSNPKLLFHIDGVGVMLSAVLLGAVLASAETTFGMPHETLSIPYHLKRKRGEKP